MNKVIVVSAHPDDEMLGVGGTLLKHGLAGDEICWIIITNMFENKGFPVQKVQRRRIEIEMIAKEIGIKKIVQFDYPTMTLSSSDTIELIPQIAKVFNEFRPEIIYTVNRSDAHSDHRHTFDAVMACTKSFRYPFIKVVLMYECISETEFAPALPEKVFIPNYFVDISKFIEKKLELVKVYQSEIGNHPFPRSIENIKALAHFRGASVGVQYAEAFQLLKYIDK